MHLRIQYLFKLFNKWWRIILEWQQLLWHSWYAELQGVWVLFQVEFTCSSTLKNKYLKKLNIMYLLVFTVICAELIREWLQCVGCLWRLVMHGSKFGYGFKKILMLTFIAIVFNIVCQTLLYIFNQITYVLIQKYITNF